MICQKCKEQGLKSSIRGGNSGSTTLAYYEPYFDEDGNYHDHDNNTTNYDYQCSNGHKFTVITGASSCPTTNCEWNKNLPKDVVRFWDE